MHFFLLNIFLALVWMFLQGSLQASNLLVGFMLGYLTLGLSQYLLGSGEYARKSFQVVRFVAFVAWEILTASLSLAWIILQPRPRIRPAVVAIELDAKTDLEIVSVADLITLSPGTLTLDLSTDRKTLYVHTIDLDDAESFRAKIKSGVERQVLEVMR